MIVPVDHENIASAAFIHSVSWQESHRSFCSSSFISLHTPDHQREYLQEKIARGSKLFMLIEGDPIGIVSVTGSLIEDLYVLPRCQNRGCGTRLLQFAVSQCDDIPTLWILENNINAERLYRRNGFKPTGRKKSSTGRLKEIEFSLR